MPFTGFEAAGTVAKPDPAVPARPLPPPGARTPAIPPPPPMVPVADVEPGPEPETEAVDPIFEPSTPLLARAFTGVARPDRPHHRPRRPDRPDTGA